MATFDEVKKLDDTITANQATLDSMSLLIENKLIRQVVIDFADPQGGASIKVVRTDSTIAEVFRYEKQADINAIWGGLSDMLGRFTVLQQDDIDQRNTWATDLGMPTDIFDVQTAG